MSKKAVKVLCTYYGQRRREFNTPLDMCSFFDINIENEISIQNGIETDVIVVNNNCGLVEKDTYNLKYQNVKTKNGIIITEFRSNVGGGFGAYLEMFQKYKSKYDYWFFCEDDVLIYKDKYMKHFIDILDSNENIGFISLAPICQGHPKRIHSGGGIGLSSTNKFGKIYTDDVIISSLSNMRLNDVYNTLEKLEVEFTSNIVNGGYSIINHPDYSPICDNFLSHLTQPRYVSDENLQKEFIYKVGN